MLPPAVSVAVTEQEPAESVHDADEKETDPPSALACDQLTVPVGETPLTVAVQVAWSGTKLSTSDEGAQVTDVVVVGWRAMAETLHHPGMKGKKVTVAGEETPP